MKYKTNKIGGWMSPIDLQWLYRTASEMESVVEIGSWKGRSTHALLSGCKGTVYAVDHFLGSKDERNGPHREAVTRDIYQEFMKNVGHFSNLKVLKMDGSEAIKQFEDKSVDMVFIDGGHTYQEVVNDIILWIPKTKKMICGHDWPKNSVKDAVTDTLKDASLNDPKGTIWVKIL